MQNNEFRFKQFNVVQNKVAMKVNTDGVLLGAWAETTEAKYILDLGTGTGVIALMMAQKSNQAVIDAIDIDHDAFVQAKANFEQSKWSNRLTAFHSSLQDFSAGKKYDLIISNPPYFVDNFKTENEKKNIAKHSTALTYEELIAGINLLLSEAGKGFLVVPIFNTSLLQFLTERENLFVTKQTDVIAVDGKKPYLAMLRLERQKKNVSKSVITIKNKASEFTTDYINLTKEFYLKF
jgi:tRNA1Val (adenine37-N6)-methyltransferase